MRIGRYVKKPTKDLRSQIVLTAALSLILNLIYALYNGVLGISMVFTAF